MHLPLIFALTLLPHMAFSGARVNLSLFALHQGATPATVGIIISLIAAIPMFYSARWGRAIDRVGLYRPMIIAAGLVFIGVLLPVLWPRMETLFVSSVLMGSGFMLYHICANQAVALVGSPEDRTRNFSVLALAFSTSGFLGPMLAGFAIDAIGHRLTFLACAGFAFVTLILLHVKRHLIRRHHKPAAQTETVKRRARDLLRNPVLMRIFVMSGLLSMCWDLYGFVIPIHGASLKFSASTIGLILGSFGSAIFLFRLILPWVVRRFNERKLLLVTMVLSGLVLALIPLVESVPLLMAVSFLLGLGLGGTQPIIMSMLYTAAPAGRGAEAVGMRTQLLNITQAGIPLIFGALGAWFGMAPVFIAMGAALLWGARHFKKREG